MLSINYLEIMDKKAFCSSETDWNHTQMLKSFKKEEEDIKMRKVYIKIYINICTTKQF